MSTPPPADETRLRKLEGLRRQAEAAAPGHRLRWLGPINYGAYSTQMAICQTCGRTARVNTHPGHGEQEASGAALRSPCRATCTTNAIGEPQA